MKQNDLKMKRSLATKQKPIRQAKFNGETYYSIVDIIEKLTGTIAPRTYWATLKKRDIQLINSVIKAFLKISSILNGSFH